MIGLLLISMIMPQNISFAKTDKDAIREAIENDYTDKFSEEDYEQYIKDQDKVTEEIFRLQDGLEDMSSSETSESSTFEGKIDVNLLKELEEKNEVDVIIRMKDKINTKQLTKEANSLSKKEDRTAFVVNELKGMTEQSQKQLLNELTTLENE